MPRLVEHGSILIEESHAERLNVRSQSLDQDTSRMPMVSAEEG